MTGKRRVVITGMGCLSPIGNGRQSFFESLRMGRSGIRLIRSFPVEHLACRVAGEVLHFNAEDWIPKKEAPHVPKIVSFALAAAHEALADAGLLDNQGQVGLSLPERQAFGVLLGSGGGPAEFAERHYQLYFEGKHHQASVYAIPSNTMGTLSSEVSMRFNLKGLSHVISTGCTSSTDAIGYAYHHIQAGRLDRAVAGGVDAPITPAIMAGFCLMRVVSTRWNHCPPSASRPFDKERDGFVLGEGAWLFTLEALESALARGVKIYGEIAGYGATCDAYHRVRLDESGEEPARAMQSALREAAVSPVDVQYINLHGTATQLNDRIETRAIHLAFGSAAKTIAASSTKSMIGHPQGASGSAGVAAALFAMETGILPPTLNLTYPDENCDLDYVPEPGRQVDIEIALCNCIGFGSKNSALILRKYRAPL